MGTPEDDIPEIKKAHDKDDLLKDQVTNSRIRRISDDFFSPCVTVRESVALEPAELETVYVLNKSPRIPTVTELSRKKQTFPKPTCTLKAFEKLINSANQAKLTELCKSQYYIETSADNLMKALGASDTGRLTKRQMRPICEKVIQKAAGAGWNVLTWGFIHGKCDDIGNQCDRNKDNAIDLFEFKLFYRSTLLYLCGAVSKEGASTVPDRAWRAQEIEYDIVSVDQCR